VGQIVGVKQRVLTKKRRKGVPVKKLLKTMIGIAVFGAAIGGIVMYFTAGMADTAEAFFQAVKRQDMSAARNYLSTEFKANTNEATLKAYLSNNSLLHFKKASWSNREISGGHGELSGEVTSDSGGVVPLKLSFLKENDAWRIYYIENTKPGLQTDSVQTQETRPVVPDTADQILLVKRSMHDFALSVNAKSMEHFYGTLSQVLQQQVTVTKLDEAFGQVYEAGMDLTNLDQMEPVIEPVSALGEHGELLLKGYFPTTPDPFHFEHQYVVDDKGWKLFGFNFRVGT